MLKNNIYQMYVCPLRVLVGGECLRALLHRHWLKPSEVDWNLMRSTSALHTCAIARLPSPTLHYKPFAFEFFSLWLWKFSIYTSFVGARKNYIITIFTSLQFIFKFFLILIFNIRFKAFCNFKYFINGSPCLHN